MKNKTKSEIDSPLRVPKAKNKLGLKIHKIAMPHDDLIRAEKPHLELVEKESLSSLSSLPSQTTQTRHSKEIAPSKDFQKTPNSLTRKAIPDGLFKGKSKQLYDALYSLTRGAIIPNRSVRIRKSKLMKLANIGSRVTFDSNINHLQTVGLISETIFTGEHGGNQFEIFLPEEAESMSSLSSLSSLTSSAQKQDRLVSLETSHTSQGEKPINMGIADVPKTSFKDNIKNDDEGASAFSEFLEKVSAACERLTGKPTTKREAAKWGLLADLLILELETAARKTDSISSVPAFLTEVLRRQFFAARRAPLIGKSSKAKPDTVGKPDEAGEYEIKPLDQAAREAALDYLKEFADEEFLEDFRKWYTPDDWEWLMAELKKSREIETDDDDKEGKSVQSVKSVK